MKNIWQVALISVFTIWLTSCVGLKQEKVDKLVFQFEKTSCFGECPTYSMQFFESGKVSLQGVRYIEKIGAYELKLKPSEISKLTTELDEMGFCELERMYGNDALDFPSNIIKYECNGKEKKVVAITEIPSPLVAFIKRVDELRKNTSWKKLQDADE